MRIIRLTPGTKIQNKFDEPHPGTRHLINSNFPYSSDSPHLAPFNDKEGRP